MKNIKLTNSLGNVSINQLEEDRFVLNIDNKLAEASVGIAISKENLEFLINSINWVILNNAAQPLH
jgi:hypothetical protein